MNIRIVILKTLMTLCLTALLMMPASLSAQQKFDDDWTPKKDHKAYSEKFNGMFTQAGVRFGAPVHSFSAQKPKGLIYDAGLRFSFPLGLLDTRIAYRYHDFDSAKLHGLGLSTGVHPFYLFYLGSDWLSYVFASFYFNAGIDAYISSQSQNGLALHLGAGLDFPLWDPDKGQALWLETLYRYQWPFVTKLNHAGYFYLGLAWRINRLPF